MGKIPYSFSKKIHAVTWPQASPTTSVETAETQAVTLLNLVDVS